MEGTLRKSFLRGLGTIGALGLGIAAAYSLTIDQWLFAFVLEGSMTVFIFFGIHGDKYFNEFGIIIIFFEKTFY